MAEVLLPKNAFDPGLASPDDFKDKIKGTFSRHIFQIRLVILFGLWLFNWIAFFRYGRFFGALNLKKKQKYYLQWFKSSSLLVYVLLKPTTVLIYSSYYSLPVTAEKLGFKEKGDEVSIKPKNVNGILETPKTFREIEVEICVIGSGAGGAVVAKELAEKGHQVLILEEGGYFSLEHFQKLSTFTRNAKIFRENGFTTTLGKPLILLPTGKCVGGTTVINSGTCFRTPASVLNNWMSSFGLHGISRKELDPYFEKIEKFLHVQAVSEELLGGNNQIIRKGAAQLKFSGEPLLRNVDGCKGSGVCIFGCPTGAKQSMERSYLPLAFKAGAKLYSHCHVKKIKTEGGLAKVIEAFFTNPLGKKIGELKVRAKKVVVACGTLNTPLLLKRSGIGKQSGQLGKNLSIHPTGKIVGIYDDIIDGFKGVPQGYSLLDDHEAGLMYESVFFPPWLLAISLHQNPELHHEVMQAYRHIAIFGFLVHDDSRGRVCAGPDGKPLVFYNLGKRELELYKKGMRHLFEVFFAGGAKKIFPSIKKMAPLEKLEDAKKINWSQIKAKDLESAAFHPLGTARMGGDPKNSVVNGDLRIHDLENIWVVDGSVFPTSLGVNPQITIMAFATRAAEAISNSP